MIFSTRVTAIGPEVDSLLESGVLILFADGAPPELAEVSVLHAPSQAATKTEPKVGAAIKIGDQSATITAIGPTAWAKVIDMGHVVINFNGSTAAERPGEICATAIDSVAVMKSLKPGTVISIG
jgi:PTS system glucitol/sorbitol-specific IIA component